MWLSRCERVVCVKDFFDLNQIMLIKNSNRAQIEWMKDRQHQSKSRLEFSFITPNQK